MSTPARQTFLDRPPFIRFWKPLYLRVLSPYVLPMIAGFQSRLFRPKHLLLSEIRQMRSEVTQLKAAVYHLREDTRKLPEKIDTVYLDSLGQWGATEHVMVSSLKLFDKAFARHLYILEQVRASHAELVHQVDSLRVAIEMLNQQHPELTGKIDQQHTALSHLIRQQADDGQRLWTETEQMIFALLAQAPPRIELPGTAENGR